VLIGVIGGFKSGLSDISKVFALSLTRMRSAGHRIHRNVLQIDTIDFVSFVLSVVKTYKVVGTYSENGSDCSYFSTTLTSFQ